MREAHPAARALARLYRPVARVEPGEVLNATTMMVAAFLLITAYYLLKTVREPLILLEGGAEVKLYARAGQAVLMVGVAHVYGEVARRVGRVKLLAIVFAFFMSNLAVFAALARTDLRIGLPFFLWVGVFSYTAVAQFWGLAADIYSEEQGKRLFPILGIGSSVGAVAGSRLAKELVARGPSALMEWALAILVACVALMLWVERRTIDGKAAGPGKDAAPAEEPLSQEGAFGLLRHDRYLVLIAIMIALLNWVNSAGEYLLDRTLLASLTAANVHGAAAMTQVGAFKADYFAWYNGLGMALQLFAVSRILGKLGVRNALLFLPAFALFGYSAGAVVPVLAIFRLVKIGENALEYSIAETSRHALYLVTSRAEKYVGKTSVDTISVRVGAILSASVVYVGGRVGLAPAGFAALNVALSGAWVAVVVAIGRENARRVALAAATSADVPGPGGAPLAS
jgi:AAA family ATP:ADP antiporter